MKLYEITGEIVTAIERYNSVETDEDLQNLEKVLTGLQVSFNDKALAVAAHITNIAADVEAIEREIARLVERKERTKKQVEWFRGYLKRSMEVTNTERIESPKFRIAIRKNPPSVVVEDEGRVPEQYKRTKTIVEIDKTAIGKAYKNGVGVDGTRVEQGTRLEIK